MQSRSVLSLSPSGYNSHSSIKLAEIAARVAQDFTQESDLEFDRVFGSTNDDNSSHKNQKPEVEQVVANSSEADNHDFEFPFLCREPYSSPIPADQIFHNGQIRPTFPLLQTGLLLGHVENRSRTCKPPAPAPPTPSIRVPLKKLLFDRDPPSSSSSEYDDLDGIPPGTYCVWKPKSAAATEESSGSCNKSKSTGSSSKRWKFRDLVRRSNSEGNDTFLFVAPSNGSAKKTEAKAIEKSASMKNSADAKVANKVKTKVVRGGAGQGLAAAAESHESYYGRNRSMKDGDRRRSFLPYKRELVGLFANVNGMSWNLLPF